MNQVILSIEFAAAILTLLYVLQLLLEVRRGQQSNESLISLGQLGLYGHCVGPQRVGPQRVGPQRVGPQRVGPQRVGPQGMDVSSAYRKRSLRNQQVVDRSR